MTDYQLGEKALNAYWNASRQLYPGFFSSFSAFTYKLQPSSVKLRILMEGIGLGIRSSEMSDLRIETAMRSMASQSKGKMPSSNHDFFRYLSNEATKIHWVDAASYVTTETAKDVLKGTAEIGDSIISAGRAINSILPILLVGGVLVYALVLLETATKGGASKLYKSLR
jgi:hypothetical protein